MAFKKADFVRAAFVARTAEVPVPDLFKYFDINPDQEEKLKNLKGKEKENFLIKEIGTVWKVRGLTSSELSSANDNATGNRKQLIQALAEALGGDSTKSELVESLTQDKDLNIKTALSCEHLVYGSVDPQIDMPTAVKLSKAFPVEFQTIVTKIAELTGLGMVDEKKLQNSGSKTKSKVV